MTAVEQNLLNALTELERAAASSRGASVPGGIRPLLDRLDQLAAELPPDAPSDLRHYLQRKSYEKARLFLLGRDAENQAGSCGH